MAAAAVVTLQGSPLSNGFVKGKYVCNAAPAATNLVLGFVPSAAQGWNATDQTVQWVWSAGMAAGTAMTVAAAAATVATGGVTALNDATIGAGLTIGTDASLQVASKTFEFIAWR